MGGYPPFLFGVIMKKGFGASRAIGNKGENLLMGLLEEIGIKASFNDRKETRQFWDIQTENGIKFEVKYDLYSARSGNIAIEFFNPKKAQPSGLTATQANFWIHVLPDTSIWCCAVEDLKVFVSNNKPVKTIAAGGDDNSSMHIYRKDLILGPVFVKMDSSNALKILNGENKCVL